MDKNAVWCAITEILNRGHDVEIRSCKGGFQIIEITRKSVIKPLQITNNVV